MPELCGKTESLPGRFSFKRRSRLFSNPDIRQEVLDERDKYARKRSDAAAEAAKNLDRIEQYGFYSYGKIVAGGSGAYARKDNSAENAVMEKQYTENEKAEIQSDADRDLENAVKLLQNSGKKVPERKEMQKDIQKIFQQAFLNNSENRTKKYYFAFHL